jgi:hypothetical protein
MVRLEVGGVTVPQGVHRAIGPLVAHLMAETMARGYKLVPGWCWGYACRPIGGTNRASNHSWGLAVDLNAPRNPLHPTRLTTDMPLWMPDLWRAWSFDWGGGWTKPKDAMHYEFTGTPRDAAQLEARLREPAVPVKIEEVKVVDRIKGQRVATARIGKGFVATNEQGAIYAWQTPDHGAYNRLRPEQRQGERLIIGVAADPSRVPTGYVQFADDGSQYAFPE